jgi:hypothetical protein
MRRTLSSIFTFPAVTLGPLIMLVTLGAFIYSWLFEAPGSKASIPVSALAAFFFVGLILFAAFLSKRIRKVSIDDDNLYISNYFQKEISVPLSDITGVTQKFSNKNHWLTIHLGTPTSLGQEITFLPPEFTDAILNQPHPMGDEIMHMAQSKKPSEP